MENLWRAVPSNPVHQRDSDGLCVSHDVAYQLFTGEIWVAKEPFA